MKGTVRADSPFPLVRRIKLVMKLVMNGDFLFSNVSGYSIVEERKDTTETGTTGNS